MPRGSDMAELQPATLESNIFNQFDVREGHMPPGYLPGRYQYYCLISPCFEQKLAWSCFDSLKRHRKQVHNVSEDKSLPNGWQINDWVARGKPRPYDIDAPAKPKSREKPRLSFKEPVASVAVAELQPATAESNVYAQFDVREEDGGRRYFCLLPPCFEQKLCLKTHDNWICHRNRSHNIPMEENKKLPTGWEIRNWVADGKPRPYDVPVKPRPDSKRKTLIRQPGALTVDTNVFKQLDIRVTNGKERFFCLLDPCRQNGISTQNRLSCKIHRQRAHGLYEGVFPPIRMFRDWIEQGKPLPYQIPRAVPIANYVEASSTGAGPSTTALELGKQRQERASAADSDLFSQFGIRKTVNGKLQYFCLLPGCIESGVFLAKLHNLRCHRRNVHKELALENIPHFYRFDRGFPYTRTFQGWIWLGNNPRPSTPPVEPNQDAGCSSAAAGPAQKKLCRSVAASREDSEEERVSSSDCETASREDYDRDCEDVDDQVVDQIPNDRHCPRNSAEMGEVGEEAVGEKLVPGHQSKQSVSSEDSSKIQAEPVTPIRMARDLDLNVAPKEEFDLNVALPQAEEET